MPKKLRPAVDLMAFKCRTLKVNVLLIYPVLFPRQITVADILINFVAIEKGHSPFIHVSALHITGHFMISSFYAAHFHAVIP
jgi:hypothetical protein